MKSYFSSGIYFSIVEAILFYNSGFNTWKKQAFLSRIMLAKACMILFLQCFGHNLSFKKFVFSHELCDGLSRLNPTLSILLQLY